MRAFVKYGLIATLVMVIVAALVSYSWTYTPIGRIHYVPAVIARLSRFVEAPAQYTPAQRAASNERGRVNMGEPRTDLVASIEDHQVSLGDHELRLRAYTPKGPGPFPLVLEIHGGGWQLGNDFVFEAPVIELAAAIPAIVVSVDYRLAPEHPFPAALDDCYAALLWLYREARALNGDPARIAVTGSSAGGHLAAALTLKARNEGGPPIRFQYLLHPVTDLVSRHWDSFQQLGDNYLLRVSGRPGFAGAYVPNESDRHLPYASPLLAESHSGLPPALISTAQFDPLRDQGKAYADKLSEADIPVEYVNVEGVLHGFVGSPDIRAQQLQFGAERIRAALYK